MRPGLVSITFRHLPPRQIANLAANAGLACVEWGGDVHVPPGDLATARSVASITRDLGLSSSAYGSYLRLATHDGPHPLRVLDTAQALGAPTVRVWAGAKGSAATSPQERAVITTAALELANEAAARGLSLSYEFHHDTLTDTAASAQQLLSETNHPAIRCFWQPPNGASDHNCLEALEAILPKLTNVHAFHWWPDSHHRLPLSDGRQRWLTFLKRIAAAGAQPDVLLEFLPGDNPSLLPQEADTLHKLLRACRPAPTP